MKKNFYKDILETIREPLCVVDSSETILYRNPAFDQHFQIDESADFHAFSQLPEKYTSISLIRGMHSGQEIRNAGFTGRD